MPLPHTPLYHTIHHGAVVTLPVCHSLIMPLPDIPLHHDIPSQCRCHSPSVSFTYYAVARHIHSCQFNTAPLSLSLCVIHLLCRCQTHHFTMTSYHGDIITLPLWHLLIMPLPDTPLYHTIHHGAVVTLPLWHPPTVPLPDKSTRANFLPCHYQSPSVSFTYDAVAKHTTLP
jgi:hypothetical protein